MDIMEIIEAFWYWLYVGSANSSIGAADRMWQIKTAGSERKVVRNGDVMTIEKSLPDGSRVVITDHRGGLGEEIKRMVKVASTAGSIACYTWYEDCAKEKDSRLPGWLGRLLDRCWQTTVRSAAKVA